MYLFLKPKASVFEYLNQIQFLKSNVVIKSVGGTLLIALSSILTVVDLDSASLFEEIQQNCEMKCDMLKSFLFLVFREPIEHGR